MTAMALETFSLCRYFLSDSSLTEDSEGFSPSGRLTPLYCQEVNKAPFPVPDSIPNSSSWNHETCHFRGFEEDTGFG
jgi:hypothetical protein